MMRLLRRGRPWTVIVARRFVFAQPMVGPNPPAVMIGDDADTRVLLKFADLEQAMCFGMALTIEARQRMDERDALQARR